MVFKSADQKSTINMNLSDIRQRLRNLHDHSSCKIKDLSSDLAKDHQALITYTDVLYNTEAYSIYYEEVKKVFGHMSQGPFDLGTVATHYAGCLPQTDFVDLPGCSVICAGSMPRPRDDPSFAFCEYPIILAMSNGRGQYQLTRLNEGMDDDLTQPEEAILFVDAQHDFTGLSNDEKVQLKDMGIRNVDVIKYSPDGKQYDEVMEGFVNVDQVPTRTSNLTSNGQPSSNGSQSNGNDGYSSNDGNSSNSSNSTIIYVVLFILLLGLVGWVAWRANRTPSQPLDPRGSSVTLSKGAHSK